MAIDYLPHDLVPGKEIIIQLSNIINVFGLSFDDFDNGKIPEDIRDGTIMATIRDFTISVIQ
jgi:hypothetical protein